MTYIWSCICSISGRSAISRMYASPMAARASSPCSPSAASAKTLRVSSRQRPAAAWKMAFLPGKRRKRYGCETPTRLAIASVEVP